LTCVTPDDDNLHLPPGYPTGISSDERAKQQQKAAEDNKKTKEEKAEEANKEPLPSELPLQLRVMKMKLSKYNPRDSKFFLVSVGCRRGLDAK
jgi:hypothetical protein